MILFHKGRLDSTRPGDPYICITEVGHYWVKWWLATWSEPSHYLTQSWPIVIWSITNKQRKFIKMQQFSIRKMHLKSHQQNGYHSISTSMVNRMRDLFLVFLTCRAGWKNLMAPPRPESTTISLCGKVQNSDSYFIKYFALIFEIQNDFWFYTSSEVTILLFCHDICVDDKRLTQVLQALDYKPITLRQMVLILFVCNCPCFVACNIVFSKGKFCWPYVYLMIKPMHPWQRSCMDKKCDVK